MYDLCLLSAVEHRDDGSYSKGGKDSGGPDHTLHIIRRRRFGDLLLSAARLRTDRAVTTVITPPSYPETAPFFIHSNANAT
ncbi:hypothetical protein JZ751_023296 [Albula glossodonta]|uniref:Uncharacterized protein n=1 Tax=Albula glossodonta TaxID=121402 RepID=A0A8T2NK61_9TELE|nr:hypothetical protein JZ751_023296 [Albula glossodonta]